MSSATGDSKIKLEEETLPSLLGPLAPLPKAEMLFDGSLYSLRQTETRFNQEQHKKHKIQNMGCRHTC